MPTSAGNPDLIERALDRPFTFHEQPVPTPAEFRPKWRVALIIVLIGACYRRRASWHQLHALNWASRSPANQEVFERLRNGLGRPDDAVVRYDPVLDRAIDLALFGKLIERRGNGDVFGLSQRGLHLLDDPQRRDVFSSERAFLQRVAPVTQVLVDSLLVR
jgi:hypothetical protein